jgi:uncharacterized protein YggL (DUF469 family)
MTHRHNSRQRKKLHLAEFREWGFGVEGELTAALSEAERDGLLDAFLDECIDKHGLVAGGGINDTLGFYIVSATPRGSVTEAQRALVQSWLEKRSEFKNVKVDPLSDIWNDTK